MLLFSGWRPFVRYANFAADRYLVVYFGNLHKFVKMAVQQDTGCIDRVTEVAVEYTNDGASWFGEETVSSPLQRNCLRQTHVGLL